MSCASKDISAPYWDGTGCAPCPAGRPHWDNECLVTCPQERPIAVADGTCTSCPDGLVGRDGACVTCAKANPARPVLDVATGRCRACDETHDGGIYWDGEACVKECPETYDIRGVCVSCASLDPKKPILRDGRCMSCEETLITPLSQDGECVFCPYGTSWDISTRKCENDCK